ncbi:MAG: threonine synthase [Pseudomonadota bacterium]|nr:threonine synthase [Pseudomonadota bacterium]
MDFISTRGAGPVGIEDAIMSGTATDGGLYVPSKLPNHKVEDFSLNDPIHVFASRFLSPFFHRSYLEPHLEAICEESFNFPLPLTDLNTEQGQLSLLELFHGPTLAFKDIGARFLAATMSRIISKNQISEPTTIIVATSGDTGAAVASAFHQRSGTRVVVLFPEGRVSERQQHQLTCWGDNIISLAVKGEFDDCQRLAKELFSDRQLVERYNLCSANSINVGRLLPQSVYYAYSSFMNFCSDACVSNYIVPTGNLGNGFACAWAKQMGFPIGELVLSTNFNQTIPDYLDSGLWEPRKSIKTLASAMDVGDPSNMERLRFLWGEAEDLRSRIKSYSVNDSEIREQIMSEFNQSGVIICPHTATGVYTYRNNIPNKDKRDKHWVVVATAHASKFNEIIDPMIGERPNTPDQLMRLLELPSEFEVIDPSINEILDRF